MTSLTVAITGATAGLGRAAAAALLDRSDVARVILVVRDPGRGAAVAAQLDPAGARTTVVEGNLASLASVERASRELGDVDVLVANAGTQLRTAEQASDDGYELTFAVNHLAHWLLADRLPTARVVVVSSGTHRTEFRAKGPYPDPQWRSATELATPGALPNGQVAYATSKLANALHVTALVSTGVDAVAFDPGLMPGTGLARDYSPLQRFAWNHVFTRAMRVIPFASTPARSGAALTQLAAERTTRRDGPVAPGAYVEIDRVKPASAAARDEHTAAQLMDDSAELVGAALATRPLARSAA